MESLQVVARTVAWALGALVAAALLSAPGGPLGPGLALAEGALVLTGDAEGLVPGQPSTVRITITNDGDAAVTVTSVTATPRGGTAACDGTALQVAPWRGTLTLDGHDAAQVELPLTVADRPECAGQTWQLAYAAS